MKRNEMLIRHQFVEELWNNRNFEVADAIFDANCHSYQIRSGSLSDPITRGPDDIKEHITQWLIGFPDITFKAEQIVAQYDKVFSYITVNGTHNGKWMGISPTGKNINIQMMTIHQIKNKKIISDWVIVESFGIFEQLGILPSIQTIISRELNNEIIHINSCDRTA